MRVYVASSWRNSQQPDVVQDLMAAGHEVYDFRNPEEGNHGFAWSDIDPGWLNWTPEEYRRALSHPLAEEGFRLDFDALKWCECCVLVLPAGPSAHMELGWAIGAFRSSFILYTGREEELYRGATVSLHRIPEPDLMYKMASGVATSIPELVALMAEVS